MAWLTGWTYRKSHTITGSAGGAQTNYEMRIHVHRTTGSDSGREVYVDTKCETDYGDIRFTKSDGDTLLDYWLESYSGTDSVFWVEVDAIAASPTTTDIYVYYGKSAQATTSNADNTFDFHDDFPGSSLDAEWNSGGDVTVTGGEVIIGDGTEGEVYSDTTYGVPYAHRVYASSERTQNYLWVGIRTNAGGDNALYVDGFWDMHKNDADFTTNSSDNSNSERNEFTSYAKDTSWHVAELARTSGVDDQFTFADDQVITGQYDCTTSREFVLRRYTTSPCGPLHVDWILSRTYVNPEPAHTSWGSEESEAVAGIQLMVDDGTIQISVDDGVIQKVVD